MRLHAEFARVVQGNPDKVALITERNQLSYRDLADLVELFDIELAARGLRPGQCLAVETARADFTLPLAILASLRGLDVVFSPLAPVVEAGIAVDRALVLAPSPHLPADRQIVVEPDWFALLGTLSQIPRPAPEARAGALIHSSSGSTGRPKFIRTEEGARLLDSMVARTLVGEDLGRLRFLSAISANTAWAMQSQIAVLLAGGSVVSLDEDRDRILQYIDLYGVDVLEATPAIVQRALEIPQVGQYLARLRHVILGGAFTGPELVAAFARVSPARIRQGYGTSEVGGVSCVVFDPDRPFAPGYLGEIFRDDLEIGFFDDSLRRIEGATEGVVGFRPRTGGFGRGYVGTGAEDAATGFHDGWFIPGDVMRREGAALTIVGRTKNILNHGGNKIALEAIGQALTEAFPGATLVPLALPDGDGIEQLVLVGTGALPAAAAIDAILAARFNGLRAARLVARAALPMTGTGKIDVQRLRADLAVG